MTAINAITDWFCERWDNLVIGWRALMYELGIGPDDRD